MSIRTKYCIGCGSPAICWTGHIHTEIGSIICGWCVSGGYCKGPGKGRSRAAYCTSVNLHSCHGEYKLSELELIEELTNEVLLEHAHSEAFSRTVDAQINGSYGRNTDTEYNEEPLMWMIIAPIVIIVVFIIAICIYSVISHHPAAI